ncbi:hypothetical protein GOODEAATRI_021715, partial [Goodea atripinnis]
LHRGHLVEVRRELYFCLKPEVETTGVDLSSFPNRSVRKLFFTDCQCASEPSKTYEELFAKLDTNKDGKVDVSELRAGLAAMGIQTGTAAAQKTVRSNLSLHFVAALKRLFVVVRICPGASQFLLKCSSMLEQNPADVSLALFLWCF